MNSVSKLLIIIVILETAAIGWLAWDKIKQEKEVNVATRNLVQAKSEKAVIEEELETMYRQYDGLKTNNQELNEQLDKEKEKIEETLRQLKGVKRGNRAKIKQLQEQTETLKSIMKDFVKQIDKLNVENKRLNVENTRIKNNYDNQIAKTDSLTEEKENLTKQVKKAKVLRAENISVVILNKRDKSTKRARKLKKIKTCFNIDDNILAKKGNRNAYVRISGPDGIILMSEESGMFMYKEKEIAYSSKRNLTYDGKKTNVCIFWTANAEQSAGKYEIDIFMDGSLIGTQYFSLK